jgi:hypothetical protein
MASARLMAAHARAETTEKTKAIFWTDVNFDNREHRCV